MSLLGGAKAPAQAAQAAPAQPTSLDSALPVELEGVATAEKPSGLRGMMSSYLDSKCVLVSSLNCTLLILLHCSPYFSAGFGLMVRSGGERALSAWS